MLYRFLPKLLLPALLLLYVTSHAQEAKIDSLKTLIDSVKLHRDSTRVAFFYSDFEKLGSLKLHPNDTTITGFQTYDPLYKNDQFYATLGNIGQNYRSLIPYPFMRESGFDYGIHTFDHYLFQNDSVRYYKVSKTFTEVAYFQGPKKEQNFRAVFSRNIYRSLNIGFDFRVSSAPGAYLRQRTNQINFVVTAQFISKNKRYGVIANFLANRLRNYENGGIKYDSLFEQNLESNRQIIPVNLSSAQNRIKETGFFMKHYFNLSRHPKNEKDTAFYNQNRIELGRLTYSFQYNRQIQNYIDPAPDTLFYPNIFPDSTDAPDSVTIKKFINEVVWSNPSFNPKKKLRVVQLEAGLKQQYIEVSYHGLKKFIGQFIPHAELDFNPIPSLRLQARGDYVIGDYNEGDFSIKVKLTTILGKQEKNAGIITLTGNYGLQQPGWFYEHYLGKFFRWDTTWNKQGVVSGGFNYRFRFLETGFSISRITNFIYLNDVAQPSQLLSEFGHIYIYLNGDINLWKFTFRTKLAYQSVQGTTILRLPAFMGSLGVYFTQPLFKGAATLQPGLNFFYNTAYYGDAYMPATRSFYLQDQKEIGNYLYMDFFINLKIQRARFFVAYTHFNAGFMGRSYYTTPAYPMQDGAFRFGISWRFHD